MNTEKWNTKGKEYGILYVEDQGRHFDSKGEVECVSKITMLRNLLDEGGRTVTFHTFINERFIGNVEDRYVTDEAVVRAVREVLDQL